MAATNAATGAHLRDFVFHTTQDTSSTALLVGASNNTNFEPREDLDTLNHATIDTAGWYTYNWEFYENADGDLEVACEALQHRVLEPGGVLAIRCFCTPEPAETIDDIIDGFATPDANPLCLRMRMAMAMASREPNYVFPIRELAILFDKLFPDRKALAEKTGWPKDEIDRIDGMRSATYCVGFPPRSMIGEMAAQIFTHVEFAESEGYPLAELCPALVLK